MTCQTEVSTLFSVLTLSELKNTLADVFCTLCCVQERIDICI